MTTRSSNNTGRLKSGFLAALTPATFTIAFAALMLCWNAFDWPTADELVQLTQAFLHDHGLPVLAIAALLEGVVLVSIWVPGSIVILVSMSTTHGDPLRAITMVLIITIAFILAAQFNYAVGRIGFHLVIRKLGGGSQLDRARLAYEKRGAHFLPILFVHPSLSSFAAVITGQSGLAWRRFFVISSLSILLWNAAWGIVFYFTAQEVITTASQPWLILAGLATWSVVAFCLGALRK